MDYINTLDGGDEFCCCGETVQQGGVFLIGASHNYLHIYSPCTIGWRFPSDQNIEVARKAVQTNFVLLWEFDPQGGLRLTHSADEPLPLAEYWKVLGKYRHLSDEQVAHIEASVAQNVKFVKGLAAGVPVAAARAGAEA